MASLSDAGGRADWVDAGSVGGASPACDVLALYQVGAVPVGQQAGASEDDKPGWLVSSDVRAYLGAARNRNSR